MRLWHKSLIPYLPRQQLLGQWRECCCIAKNIAEKGTPNHILVNRIMDYPIEHFVNYTIIVVTEMKNRGYNININNFNKWLSFNVVPIKLYKLFNNWHNYNYMTQCYYNLQEKYQCGAISDIEWEYFSRGYEGEMQCY